jgi:hypothetical protein
VLVSLIANLSQTASHSKRRHVVFLIVRLVVICDWHFGDFSRLFFDANLTRAVLGYSMFAFADAFV